MSFTTSVHDLPLVPRVNFGGIKIPKTAWASHDHALPPAGNLHPRFKQIPEPLNHRKRRVETVWTK
jgi:hypothetical protein